MNQEWTYEPDIDEGDPSSDSHADKAATKALAAMQTEVRAISTLSTGTRLAPKGEKSEGAEAPKKAPKEVKDVQENGATADKVFDKGFTGMLFSPDGKQQVAIGANKIYDFSGKFIGDLDRKGFIRKPGTPTTTINSRFDGWTFKGKEDGHDRCFTISSLTSNGQVHLTEGANNPLKTYDVVMGVMIDPKTGEQFATITPPNLYGNTLSGGTINFVTADGNWLSKPLAMYENSVFNLKLLDPTNIDSKPVAGICRGLQHNGRQEFFNLTNAEQQTKFAIEMTHDKIKGIKNERQPGIDRDSSTDPDEYWGSLRKAVADPEGWIKEQKKLHNQENTSHLNGILGDMRKNLRKLDMRCKPWQEQEQYLQSISGTYQRIIQNGLTKPVETLRSIDGSSTEVKKLLLGGSLDFIAKKFDRNNEDVRIAQHQLGIESLEIIYPYNNDIKFRVLKEKLDEDNEHPKLEQLPTDVSKLNGSASIGDDAFTIKGAQLINKGGKEIATIDPVGNTLIVKGNVSLKDGKAVLTHDDANPNKLSLVPMGCLTGAFFHIKDDTAGKQINWMCLGPNYNNKIISQGSSMANGYNERRYAEEINQAAGSSTSTNLLRRTEARLTDFEQKVVKIFRENSNSPDDLAFMARGAAREVRDPTIQQVTEKASESSKINWVQSLNDANFIAKIESGQLRVGDDLYDIGKGGQLLATAGNQKEIVGQWLPGRKVFLKGQGEIELDLKNQTMAWLKVEGQKEPENFLAEGPYRATNYGTVGGFVPVSILIDNAKHLVDDTQRVRDSYVENTPTSTRALGESETFLGKRENLLKTLAKDSTKEGDKLINHINELFANGFKKDDKGQLVISGDQLNGKVALLESFKNGLTWRLQESYERAYEGQIMQQQINSRIKMPVLTALSAGVINPVFTGLANSARIANMGKLGTVLLYGGELATTSLAGGITALCLENAPAANKARTFAAGGLEALTMSAGSVGSNALGMGIPYKQAKTMIALSQSGQKLAPNVTRFANTAMGQLVANGASPATINLAKGMYKLSENFVQAASYGVAANVKDGRDLSNAFDPQVLLFSTIAGIAGEAGGFTASKFMSSAEGKTMLQRVTNSMVPSVIEEFNGQIAQQDQATAERLGLSRDLINGDIAAKNRDIGAALAKAIEAAAPAGLASLTISGVHTVGKKAYSVAKSVAKSANENLAGREQSQSKPIKPLIDLGITEPIIVSSSGDVISSITTAEITQPTAKPSQTNMSNNETVSATTTNNTTRQPQLRRDEAHAASSPALQAAQASGELAMIKPPRGVHFMTPASPDAPGQGENASVRSSAKQGAGNEDHASDHQAVCKLSKEKLRAYIESNPEISDDLFNALANSQTRSGKSKLTQLTAEQIARLTHKQERIQALTTKQLLAFDKNQLKSIFNNTRRVSVMTDDQYGALLDNDRLPDLEAYELSEIMTPDRISALTTKKLLAFDKEQLWCIFNADLNTEAHLKAMTEDQYKTLLDNNRLRDLPNGTLARIVTPDRIGRFGLTAQNLLAFDKSQLMSVFCLQNFKAMTDDQYTILSGGNRLPDLSDAVLPQILTPERIKALPAKELLAFDTHQLWTILNSQEQVKSITDKQFTALFKDNRLLDLSNNALSQIVTPERISALTPKELIASNINQLRKTLSEPRVTDYINDSQFLALVPKFRSDKLDIIAIRLLDKPGRYEMLAEQDLLKELSGRCLEKLISKERLSKLSPEQLSNFDTDQLNHIFASKENILAVTDKQFEALLADPSKLEGLSSEQVALLVMRNRNQRRIEMLKLNDASNILLKYDEYKRELNVQSNHLAVIIKKEAQSIKKEVEKDRDHLRPVVLLGRDAWPLVPYLRNMGVPAQYFLFSTLQIGDTSTAQAWLKEVPPGALVIDTGYVGSILNEITRIDPTIDFADGKMISSASKHWRQLSEGTPRSAVEAIESLPKIQGRASGYTPRNIAIARSTSRGDTDGPALPTSLVIEHNIALLRDLGLAEEEVEKYKTFTGLTPKERLGIPASEIEKHYQMVEAARQNHRKQ